MSISGCKISNNEEAGAYCWHSSNIIISGCEINNNLFGVQCDGSSSVEIHYCNIFSNERLGLHVCGTYLVNATHCWWGSLYGPEYKEYGDPEDPEEVYGDVIYEPWLTEPWEDVEPPIIEESIISPEEPLEGEEVTIKVKVSDVSGVVKVILSYSVDKGVTWTNVTMILVPDGYYIATIPGQPVGTTVLYKIYARDAVGNWAVGGEGSFTVSALPIEEPEGVPLPPACVWYVVGTIAAVAIIISIALKRKRPYEKVSGLSNHKRYQEPLRFW